MPEYLAPGVYVEEVSFRAKTIEGVPTSTTGFAGMTRWGPVRHPEGPLSTEPRLITSFTEFERVYGGLERLHVGATDDERESYLAHAARAFFMNGGKRLYVSRVFVPRVDGGGNEDWGVASRAVAVGGGAPTATWTARWPGRMGEVNVTVEAVRSGNLAYAHADAAFGIQAQRAKAGALVEIVPSGTTPPVGNADLDANTLAVVTIDADGKQTFNRGGAAITPAAGDVIQLVELRVRVRVDPERVDVYEELGVHPSQKRFIGKILDRHDPEDEDAVVWLRWDDVAAGLDGARQLAVALQQNPAPWLDGGHDGDLAMPDDLAGEPADPDDAQRKATGLEALGEVDDIAIVALPDGGTYDDATLCGQAADRAMTHAELMRYRIAVVDGPARSSLNEIREFRGAFDSKYAALYYPWIEILDPLERPAQGAPPRRLLLPPSGFVTGIYARNDVERGVWKAPANEVVRGLTRFELNINKGRQDVLNPEHVNALRFFEGRGNRVWGARTLSSDPEWRYVNVRRFFIFLEHSIDKATQWAVFEPNGERLWANIRRTVEDFLLVQWLNGALLGSKPEEAYFVRCDRTTMTQNDLDNGRLICLIGVAPVKPAEFVIFRIGQWTADAGV
jgi:phage tail sheath protein FI